MFRTLAMFPADADESQVADLVSRTAAAFRRRPSFRRMTTSVDSLMGPAAREGRHGIVYEADFDDLEDVLGVLEDESFREVRIATEALGPTLLLFEYREV
jgi:hypothetical protein